MLADGAETTLNVFGPFLRSLIYINCNITIADTVFIDYCFFPMLYVHFIYNVNFFWKFLICDY